MDTLPAPRRLTSHWTIVPKYIVPLVIAALLVFTIWAGLRDGTWWEIVLWGGFILVVELYAVAFAWDFCHASTDGTSLHVKGLRASAVVPLADVSEVVAFTRSRWPHIDIVLRTPTPLGREFRLMPKTDSLVAGGTAFWETFDLLSRNAATARHDAPPGAARTTRTRAPAVFGITAVVVAAIVAAALLIG